MNGYFQSADGGHQTECALMVNGPAELTDLEVVFLLSPYQRSGAQRAYGAGTFFQKAVAPGQREFVFYSGLTARLDVWAKGRLDGQETYAQTILSTFGQSGLSDPTAKPLSQGPDWPSWSLAEAHRYYRAQTGTPLEVRFPGNPKLVQVFEDQIVMANYPGESNGLYRYVSTIDYGLARKGYVERKRDVAFVAYDRDGSGQASFSLPVYRAYYGQLDYKKGLAVFWAFFLGSMALVGLKGQRFKGP
jgi:hypothetical protein